MISEDLNEDINPKRCMWSSTYLKKIKNAAWIAPVTFFKHAPFASNWEQFAKRKEVIEFPNQVCDVRSVNGNWVGTIKCYAGYKALVEYHQPSTGDSATSNSISSTWISFCSDIPKPIGYSMNENILLHPPIETTLEAEHLNSVIEKTFQSILFRETRPPETIKDEHYNLVLNELKRCSSRFFLGETVEAIDKNDCSRYRVAQISTMVGDRVNVRYIGEDPTDTGFWFSQHSHHIHKRGWCQVVGAPLKSSNKIIPSKSHAFSELNLPLIPPAVKIRKQMIFEMRHPVLTHKIVTGYVVKVLKHGFFIAGTDWTRPDELVEIVLHVSSDYLLPLGFCHQYRIPLQLPNDALVASNPKRKRKAEEESCKDDKGEFSWKDYVAKNKLKQLNTTPIIKEPNKFVKGCKLEAVVIDQPVLLRPATVIQVAGRLIRIHFDGFKRDDPLSYQWVSCDSSNIYPVGYAEMVGHSCSGEPDAPRHFDHFKTGTEV